MKTVLSLIAASTALLCTSTFAQFVKGNEAVKVAASGRRVDLPPLLPSIGKVCNANANCYAGYWHMVETDAGLVECTEPWARQGSCRSSTYGTKKLPRVWVVQKKGEWLQCQYPDLSSRCTPMFARPPANLPFDAIQ